MLAVFLLRTADIAETWYALGGVEPLAYSLAAATALVVALVAGCPPRGARHASIPSSRCAPNRTAARRAARLTFPAEPTY